MVTEYVVLGGKDLILDGSMEKKSLQVENLIGRI
jgi:hypothetical protein